MTFYIFCKILYRNIQEPDTNQDEKQYPDPNQNVSDQPHWFLAHSFLEQVIMTGLLWSEPGAGAELI